MSAATTAESNDSNNNDTTNTPTTASSSDVMLQPSPRLDVLSFAVSVPASSTMESMAFEDDYYDESDPGRENLNAKEMANDDGEDLLLAAAAPKTNKNPLSAPPPKVVNENVMMEGMGIVGTIIVLKTSYIVWFGWGQISDPTESTAGNAPREGVNHSRLVGSIRGSNRCRMGQCLISMPPKKFPGTLSTHTMETSTSKLIGGGDEDDMIARQMASRLSQRSGRPVLVSCNLDSAQIQSMGLDPDLLHARASALAEQRIWKLLQEQQRE